MKKNLTAKIITFIILIIEAISLIFGSFIMLLWNNWETPVQQEQYQEEIVVENNEENAWEEVVVENNEENIWEEEIVVNEEVSEANEGEENL